MRHYKIVTIALFLLIPAISHAQYATYKHKVHHHVIKSSTMPPWAEAHKYDATAHVYFPDYHSFYDPARGGYVFWENGAWSFTPTVPPYMSNKDLGKERVQILKGISLDLHPELDYPRYMELYPATHEYNDVPTPLPIAGGQ
jgi:hypothetical protein